MRFSPPHASLSRRSPHRTVGDDGFTLVELLVVTAILGILSGVVVFAVRGVGDKGHSAAVATDERIIRTAEEAYCAQNGHYTDGPGLVTAQFLSSIPEYHAVTAGDAETEGNCPDTPKHYKIACQQADCGAPGLSPTTSTTSTTVAPVELWSLLGSGPTPRIEAGMAPLPGASNLVMFGGSGPGPSGSTVAFSALLGDTWVWKGSWVLAAAAQESGCPTTANMTPCPRTGHAMAYDAAIDKVVMVGGFYKPGQGALTGLQETWTWNGTTWSSAGWGPESVHGSLAYDAQRGNLVLFGGSVNNSGPGASTFTNATWTWDGQQWHQETPSTYVQQYPAARENASMAFDPVTKRVLLFGGEGGGNTVFGDTWAWDGSDWAPASTSSGGPPARAGASMATDTTTGRIILFGGAGPEGKAVNGVCCFFDDTWEWTGSAWTPRAPTRSPSGRSYAAIAYEATSKALVLFGGEQYVNQNTGTYSNSSSETWAYKRTTPTTIGP